MQQYVDIYSLQNYSTCFGCHSTHHQEYQKLYPQPPVQVILLVLLLPSYVVWSGLQTRPCRRGVVVQVVRPVPEVAGTVFDTPDDGCCDTRNM